MASHICMHVYLLCLSYTMVVSQTSVPKCSVHFAGPVTTTFKNCQEIRNAGYTEDGIYYVDVDGPGYGRGPFEVHCNLNEELGTGITEIFHDSMRDFYVNGFEQKGSYVRKITYNINMEDIRQIMSSATTCQQYFRYKCHGSVFQTDGEGLYAWWTTWDGRNQSYWQQDSVQERKCWCGVKGICTRGKKCECDINDLSSRVDAGSFHNMDDLPITALYFGDTGDEGEYGIHYLGDLRCRH